MPPKRAAAAVATAPPAKRASRTRAEPEPAPAATKGKAKAKKEPEPEPELEPEPKAKAKAKGKKEPEPKPAPAQKGKKGKAAKKGPEPDDFVEKLLEVCKILMTVMETTVTEDADKMTITTEEDFAMHGTELLELLPKEARRPMMKMAVRYQQALDNGPPWNLLDDDEVEDDEDEDAEEDADEEIFVKEHFYFFKQWFTTADAIKFMEGVDTVCEKALDSMFQEDEDEDGEEEEEEEADEDEEADDEEDWMNPDRPWKDE